MAKDVCDCLGISNARDAVAFLDTDEKITVANPDGNPRAGIPHRITCISKPGLYDLILRSRKPEAKAFSRWVRHDILPAVEKHGGYLTPSKVEEVLLSPDTIIKLATNLKAEQERRQAAEEAREKAEGFMPKI